MYSLHRARGAPRVRGACGAALLAACCAALLAAAPPRAAAQIITYGNREIPPAHYTYIYGGRDWASADFPTCKGTMQSPINVPDDLALARVPPEERSMFNYGVVSGTASSTVINNGHTVQLVIPTGFAPPNASVVVVGPLTNTKPLISQNVPRDAGANLTRVPIKPLQLHFHAHSEHLIGGKEYPLEMHIVNAVPQSMVPGCPSTGCLTVVGVLFEKAAHGEVADSIMELAKIADCMSSRETVNVTLDAATLDLSKLMPADKTYITYAGSLTTPPCTEGVLWHLLTTPVKVSPEQLYEFQLAVSDTMCGLTPPAPAPARRLAGAFDNYLGWKAGGAGAGAGAGAAPAAAPAAAGSEGADPYLGPSIEGVPPPRTRSASAAAVEVAPEAAAAVEKPEAAPFGGDEESVVAGSEAAPAPAGDTKPVAGAPLPGASDTLSLVSAQPAPTPISDVPPAASPAASPAAPAAASPAPAAPPAAAPSPPPAASVAYDEAGVAYTAESIPWRQAAAPRTRSGVTRDSAANGTTATNGTTNGTTVTVGDTAVTGDFVYPPMDSDGCRKMANTGNARVEQALNGRTIRIWVDATPCAKTVADAVRNSTALAKIVGPTGNATTPISINSYDLAVAANLTQPCAAAATGAAGDAAPARAAAAALALLAAAALLA